MAKRCPCCAGERTGDWMELCEDCLGASLSGGCEHAKPFPRDDIDILQDNPTHVVKVHPIDHELGQAWPWRVAMRADRAGCGRCGPGLPCWRHADPQVDMVDYADTLGAPALGVRCYSGAAGDACTGEGWFTLQRHRDGRGMVGSACEPCTLAYLGPVAVSDAG
jgi:hypothetical protein